MDEPLRLDALLSHARALVGARLGDLAEELGLAVPAGTVRTKGWSGMIIERELGASEETGRGQDFAALGVELKTVPVDERGRPIESTAVCNIDPVEIAGESWDTSYTRRKLARVLFVALRVPFGPDRQSVGERIVDRVHLWTPSPAEDALLRVDFELLVRDYFRRGRAAAITGHVGAVLQVRPKARNNRDTRAAFGPEGEATRIGKLGFYLRPAFVGAILARAETSLST